MNDRAFADELGSAVGEEVVAISATAGGSINEAWRAELADGRAVFVKSRAGATAAEFAAEAAGLAWLAEPGSVRVPEVLGVGEERPWLALEWVEPGILGASGRGELGRDLARLHAAGADSFGALPPGINLKGSDPFRLWRIGPLELQAAECESWPELYAEHRLRPLLRRAHDSGRIGERDGAAIECVCERIGSLCGPAEPPARLHGDLWSGNVHADHEGLAWLIDPAPYGGHREIDLAMLLLFGQPGTYLFDAYDEFNPRAEGHEERVELWQLLPLLVHAVLFGGGYGAQAGAAARRYA